MGEKAEDAATAEGASDPSDSTGKRFLGRILSAFASTEGRAKSADETRAQAARAATLALPGVANLRRLRVDDVAMPKAEIVAVPVSISLDDLVATFRATGFSRLPVYKGGLDTPLGIIHLKDLALQQAFDETKPKFALRKLLRPLLYVPPSMTLAVLLQKMQSERIHMALVIDEYGGVDGLVTIEDLIETVIGEIDDEHDDEEDKDWLLEKPGQYIVLARTPLEEFEAAIGMSLSGDADDDEIDTVGGLIFRLSGSVPAEGAVISHASGAQFEILEADARRIKRLRVRLPQGGA